MEEATIKACIDAEREVIDAAEGWASDEALAPELREAVRRMRDLQIRARTGLLGEYLACRADVCRYCDGQDPTVSHDHVGKQEDGAPWRHSFNVEPFDPGPECAAGKIIDGWGRRHGR